MLTVSAPVLVPDIASVSPVVTTDVASADDREVAAAPVDVSVNELDSLAAPEVGNCAPDDVAPLTVTVDDNV